MDGRYFHFSVLVKDRSTHSTLAKTSNMFILYAEIVTTDESARYEVAVPVTSGGKGNLCLGKRGIFRDTSGQEFDARIVQIIENPISIIEAMVSPFKRLARLLTGKIESLTSAAEKRLDSTAATALQASAAKSSSGLMAGGLLMGGSLWRLPRWVQRLPISPRR